MSNATLFETAAPGTTEGEKTAREQSVRRLLCPLVMVEIQRRFAEHDVAGVRVTPATETKDSNLELLAMLMIDSVYAAIAQQGWAIHKRSPCCASCGVEMERKHKEFKSGEAERQERVNQMHAEWSAENAATQAAERERAGV